MNRMISTDAAAELIRSGAALSVAGVEAALDRLPAGNWIGGTSPYFMVASGGTVVDDSKVFVTELSGIGQVSVASYGADELAGICGDAPENGFAVTIIPFGGACHQRFALDAASFPNAFLRPTVGWIAGVHLSEIGKTAPLVYDGRTAAKFRDRAVVAHVALPEDRLVSVEIVNLFEPDDGDILRFTEASFEIGTCEVNGKTVNFADYVAARGLEHGQQPLVGDFAGAHLNVSLQSLDNTAHRAALYAPVFPGVDYRFAKSVGDYAAVFRTRLTEQDTQGAVMACNCILNFVFGELEGKAIGGIEGPITFGEIAYQLLNQTAVIVRIL
ncbi:MAG: hypothetical protein KGR48_16150 [Alphaproteobacteria bacterium]|nr:hypothetical protein [Alphaproteobacteria bacterium]MDE2012231.1 hypothetical protein [Alphaproteobacteria bacterium]MDE2074818.1 hypothetical protein [Alphaproteobacteria bacterium]MDE2350778.1 hypothetical protein [Alphaproteobacteria bacterium]